MKKKKKKLRIKRFIIFITVILFVFLFLFYIVTFRIKNIYILNNHIYTDDEIKDIMDLNMNKSFVLTPGFLLEMKLKKDKIIKDVKVKKEFFGVVKVEVTELKPYFIINNNIVVFEDKVQMQDKELIETLEIPYLISKLSNDTFENLITAMNNVDIKIINKISEIEYKPTELDKERFLFLMRDGNYSYVSLNNIENINYYNKIVPKLEGKKGIINFDSYRKNDAGISITLIE